MHEAPHPCSQQLDNADPQVDERSSTRTKKIVKSDRNFIFEVDFVSSLADK
jgi:hypothetical protein